MRRLARVPVLGPALLAVYRLGVGWKEVRRPAVNFFSWLLKSRETTNFTYDLTPLNKQYLAAFVAEVTGSDPQTAADRMTELEADRQLREHLGERIRSSPDGRLADPEIHFGRRLGWYAIVRLVRPRLVVETGVDKGLGACVLTAALRRNTEEGQPGRYLGTDVNPAAGFLLAGRYAELGEVLRGDSVHSLVSQDGPIDVFIHDSNHAAGYEAREYEAIRGKLGDRAIVLSDNAHVTGELLEFARRTGRRFLYFQEQPRAHWYRGAGIGAAFGPERPASRVT